MIYVNNSPILVLPPLLVGVSSNIPVRSLTLVIVSALIVLMFLALSLQSCILPANLYNNFNPTSRHLNEILSYVSIL